MSTVIPIGSRTFYARKWLVYLIITISCMPALALLFSGEKIHVLGIVLLIEIVISWIIYSLLNRIMITIDDKGITHRTVFRKRFMDWKDIRETKVVVEMGPKSNQHFWYFISTDNKQIRFNTSFFSKKTIRAVAETVIQQSPGAYVNESVVAYSQGKFPWYAF